MPNNNVTTIDFPEVKPAVIKAQFDLAEESRVNDDIDGALRRMNALNTKLYASYYVLGAMPLIICVYMFTFNNSGQDDKARNHMNLLWSLLALIAVRQEIKLPLSRILKHLNAYKGYLYLQKSLLYIENMHKEDLQMKQYSAEDAEERASRMMQALFAHIAESNKFFTQSLIYTKDVGLSAKDTLLLHLAVNSQGFSLKNADVGLGPIVLALLNANVDPNCLIPSTFHDGQTLVFTYALSSNWRAVSELLDRFPNLDVATCPQKGIYKGQSVLALSAINNRWDICARLVSSFKQDLNLPMEGLYKNRDKECQGKQVIWVVARAGKTQLVRALINKGAKVNAESLQKIVACCDLSVIEFGIEKGAFSKQQVMSAFDDCKFEVPLLSTIVDLDLWEELRSIVSGDSELSSASALAISRKFTELYSDTRYLNLHKLVGASEVRRRITAQLKAEATSNLIVSELLGYSSDIIRKFMNLDASSLQELFDPISNVPAIISPVKMQALESKTTHLYERCTITKWIRQEYSKDHAVGNVMPSAAKHPESKDKIDLDSLVELSAKEINDLVSKVRSIANGLVLEAKSQHMLNQY